MSQIKKGFLFLSLSSLIFLVLGGQQVEGITVKTELKGITGFEANEDPVVPVNPDNPDEEIETGDKPSTEGPLSINYVTDFNFGIHPRSLRTERYTASLAKMTIKESQTVKEVPHFIQITDNRGTKAGWKLFVQQNGLLKNEKGYELSQSHFDFQAIIVRSPYGMTEVPTKVFEKVTLNGENQSKELLVEAEKGSGMGSWHIQFGQTIESGITSVGLNIPAKVKKEPGYYTTSLTWTLEDSY